MLKSYYVISRADPNRSSMKIKGTQRPRPKIYVNDAND